MKSKSALYSAALMLFSMVHFGAQAAVTEYQVTISGVGDPTTVFTVPVNVAPSRFISGYGFELGPIEQLTNGVAMTDTFTFYDASQGGGLSDSGNLYKFSGDAGAQLYIGPVSSPTLRVGRFVFANANDGNIDMIAVVGIPEIATWAMMVAGFGALALAGYRFDGDRPRRLMVSVGATQPPRRFYL
jgi:hypothetical protein